ELVPDVLDARRVFADQQWSESAGRRGHERAVWSTRNLAESANARVGIDVQKDPRIARAWQGRGGGGSDLHDSSSNVRMRRRRRSPSGCCFNTASSSSMPRPGPVGRPMQLSRTSNALRAISRPIASKLTKYSVIRKLGMHALTWSVHARPIVVLL